MELPDVHALLSRTLEDRRLSRAERQSLDALLGETHRDPRTLDHWRGTAFEIARAALALPEDQAVLEWLEDVVRVLRPRDVPTQAAAESYFSPGDECPRAIARRIEQARTSVDVCVFTITDNVLADALIAAHGRGVALRVLTDNEKAEDEGSDIVRLGRAGVPVRVDRSPYHMHHKFALFDRALLLTGSYNWTRGAARDNAENFIITPDPRLLAEFTAQFERLWEAFA